MSYALQTGNTQHMSSVEIAQLCEKQHGHVIRDIHSMLEAIFGHDPFLDDPENKAVVIVRDRRNYVERIDLDKAMTLTLVAGYRADLRYRIVQRWMELETAARVPANYLEALEALVSTERARQALAARNAELAPKAAAADRLSETRGLKTLREVAKILGMGPRVLLEELRQKKIIYRAGPDRVNLPMQRYIDCGYFEVRERPYRRGDEEQLYSAVYVTGKGEVWLAHRVSRPELGLSSTSTVQ